MKYADPYYDTSIFPFPSRVTCPDCDGSSGSDNTRHHDPMQHPDYYWLDCNLCEGHGDLFNPHTRAISRRVVSLRPKLAA